MSYKIVIDSCGELPEKLKTDDRYESVPLTIDIEGKTIIDDNTFNQAEFLKLVNESAQGPKSSCPSPERYKEAFHSGADHNYGVTLSSRLSGSYNSAELGKQLCIEEYGEQKIYVFDSKSASVGETLIALKVTELEEAGNPYEEIIKITENYIQEMKTYFVLETLETLRKNGRLSNLKAFVANALNIKPVMSADDNGEICLLTQARGINKALDKMVQLILEKTSNKSEKTLAISHCNCKERAEMIREKLQKEGGFKEILILETAGISSMYANNGGIIVTV